MTTGQQTRQATTRPPALDDGTAFDRRREAAKAAAGGVVAAGVFALAATTLVRANLLRCGDGMAAFGCAIASVVLALAVALALAAGAAAFALRLLGARRPVVLAVAGTVTAAGAWPFAQAVSTSGATAVAGVAVACVLAFVAHSQFPSLSAGLRLVVALAVAVAAFTLLRPVGAEVEETQHRQEQRRELAAVDFDVYAVTPPPGYRLHSARLTRLLSTDPEQFVMDFLYGDNVDLRHRVLELRSFRLPRSFRPERDCGYWQARDEPWPGAIACRPAGEVDGAPLYVAKPDWTDMTVYYLRKGDTLVTLARPGDLSPTTARRMLGSLRRTTPERLVDAARD
jgi:hypothetical protein